MHASIIIPAYNNERTIQDCVKSVKEQRIDGTFEVIVVDDGSSDATSALAENCGAIVLRQENAGPAKARNNGARHSTGEVLVFIDSDCLAEKNWLSEMLSAFADKSVCGVQGAYRTRQKSLVARFVQIEIEERYEKMKRSENLDWIGSYSAAYRKKDFFEAGGFDESFPIASGEDPELSYKMAEQGKKLVFNPQAIVYHSHPDSLEKYVRTKFFRAFYRIPLYKKHAQKAVSDSYTPQLLKVQIALFYMIVAGKALWLLGIVSLQVPLAVFVVLLISTLPLAFFATKKDLAVGLATPFIVVVRTIAFGTGLLAGALFADKREKNKEKKNA